MNYTPRILIVDDDPYVVNSLKRLLKSRGYEASLSYNGHDAMACLEKACLENTSFDIVLLDLVMPDMDGFEVMDYIREKSPDSLAIIVTGQPSVKFAVEALRRGAHDFIQKPFENEKLIATVKNALSLQKMKRDRERAEKDLRQSQALYKDLVETVSDMIWEVDASGCYNYINPRSLDILGYNPEELIGKPFTQTMAHDETLPVNNIFNDFVSSPRPFESVETTMIHKTGIPLTLENSGKPFFDDSGGLLGYRGVNSDITARKRYETQLRQVNRMEAIGTLAGGVAHDFNNILGIIVGNTELSLDNVPEWNPAHQNLNEILTACLRARDTVKQILAFSRQNRQEQVPVKVKTIVEETIKLLRASLPSTIEIRQQITSSGLVMADPTQLHQVIMNLCTNAAHAMRENGGVLEIGLSDLVLDETACTGHLDLSPGNYVRLTVKDTGHGIQPDIIERVFEPYFTTKPVDQGSGLGLAVVHGITKSHGGCIKVYSEPGKETCFQVFLPVIDSNVKPGAQVQPPIPGGIERILFVDDERSLVEAVGQQLENLGYTVSATTSPTEALGLFYSMPDQFDLVITDMTMPGLTGDHLATEIMRTRADMPIILCTGYSDLISEAKALAMGIRGLVLKPTGIRTLAQAIRNALDKGKTDASSWGRILVVDDEEQMRTMIRQMLERSGYEVTEAPNGSEAISRYRERPSDVVITDLIMPEKEGIETIVELRHEHPDVKLIAISGGGAILPEGYLDMAKKLGANYTFAKPFEREKLLMAVKNLLTRETPC